MTCLAIMFYYRNIWRQWTRGIYHWHAYSFAEGMISCDIRAGVSQIVHATHTCTQVHDGCVSREMITHLRLVPRNASLQPEWRVAYKSFTAKKFKLSQWLLFEQLETNK